MATLNQKLMISSYVGLFFLVTSLPATYEFTNNLLTPQTNMIFDPNTKCQTYFGHLVHTLIFFLLTYASMFVGKGDSNISNLTKIKHSLYGTLIYFLISNKAMYQLTGSFIPGLASKSGCPTLIGIFVHTIVYIMALVGVMYLP